MGWDMADGVRWPDGGEPIKITSKKKNVSDTNMNGTPPPPAHQFRAWRYNKNTFFSSPVMFLRWITCLC